MCATVTIRSLREVDELPDGTRIVIEDKRDTPLFKRDGDWYSPYRYATQNVFTYVNTRRWGVRVTFIPTE